MTRVAWLVGSPGAGKSTFARRQHEFVRVVEFTAMLGPLVDSMHLRKGVLAANQRLVDVVRAVEFHPANVGAPAALVVAGLVPENVLFPVHHDEEVLLLLPERQRWERQLRMRPLGGGSSRQYDDIPYATEWYERFEEWLQRGLPLRRLDVAFDPALLGRVDV